MLYQLAVGFSKLTSSTGRCAVDTSWSSRLRITRELSSTGIRCPAALSGTAASPVAIVAHPPLPKPSTIPSAYHHFIAPLLFRHPAGSPPLGPPAEPEPATQQTACLTGRGGARAK